MPSAVKKTGLSRALARQSWIVLGLLVVVIAGSVYVLRRKEIPHSTMIPSNELALAPSVDLRFTNVQMQGREKGTLHWTIEAPTVEVSNDQRMVTFEGHPRGKFFNLKDWSSKPKAQQKNRTVDWTADSAIYDSDYKQMTIMGHDRFVTDDGDKVTTKTVIYQENQHLVQIPTPMQLHSHDGKLAILADEATADTQLEVIELAGNVRIDSKVGANQL